ncbi:MAG: SLBB domain-containing protein [Bacteroidaceae bacterium]|nr:SLBB domain-containing protein [Bacteroidaceae bacterium]
MKLSFVKKLLFILTLSVCPVVALAQSMTDEQVVKYVTQQQELGKSQQDIVTSLLKKGVTTEQLRRIRKKYQAEQTALGAQNLTSEKKTPSRLRTEQQEAGEKGQMRNQYMVQSMARMNNPRYGTQQERMQAMNDEIGFMDIDSLIYYQNYFKNENEVFGRNIFNNQMLTFQPNMNMATPANYRLGAGDEVIIDVWGASQETFTGPISPDGVITIEGVGPCKIGGMSVSEANAFLKEKLGQFYSGSNIQLSVGGTRTIQVQVMGEVNVPGTYSLSSLSSAFNALYAAGGISDIGTLRDIKVYRQGRQISSIDVYDYLMNGNSRGDVRLSDNDVILVGPYDALVEIRGKVKRPMFYEMKKNESLKTILSYSGGFTGDAYKKSIRVTRKNGAEYSIHTVGEFDWSSFTLCDGDSVTIDSVVARYSNMVEVRGAVFHSGMYQMDGKINTVRELVKAAEGLREDAFTARAVMHRQKADLTLEVLSVDILGIMNGTVADIPLRKNDVLFIPSKLDLQGERTFTISGEVKFPGSYVYADNTTIEDLVLQAGGLTDAASTVKVDVYRRIDNPLALEDDENLTETFTFALKEGFVVDGQQGFVLEPFDMVAVRKSPSYSEQQNVKIKGSVNFEGTYAMTNKNYKLSDLVKAAGGISSLGYAKGARLDRMMTEEERQQQEASLRASQIALYEESMQADNKNFDLSRADSLLNMKLDIGNTFPVAIDLEAALKNPGGEDDIVLREGDLLIVPQYSSTVKISGDVMHPTSMNYRKGESLNYYIKHAGGYGDNARKSRVYAVYMNGSVELVKHSSSKAVQPGCTIVVPSKKSKNKMTTAEYAAMGTSAASIATMMVTIANILK